MSRPTSSTPKVLLALLGAVVIVEGFDTNLANVALPYVGETFSAEASSLRSAQSLIALGAVAAFFVIRCADRWGRRPVLLGAVAGFALLSLATAFAQDLQQFIVLQFCARIALVSQISLAYVLLSESTPADRRGRVNGMLAAFASLGAALPALLLQPTMAMGHDWRSLFVLGGLPLLVLPLLWRWVDESPAFLARGGNRDAASLGQQLRRLLAPDLRRRFLGVSGLWFVINFWVAATMFLFTLYAVRERGWTPHDIQRVAPAGLVCALGGYLFAGWLMDAIGRRMAAALLLLAGAVATVVAFRAQSFLVIATAWVCLQALQGVWPVAHTLTTELFPTEVRASANGLSHNLIGRWGQVAGPSCVNLVALAVGSTGTAVAVLACVNLLALPLLFWALPETRRVDLTAREPAC